MEGYAKLHCLVHEFIHHVARVLTKYTYDKCTYEGEFENGINATVENVRHSIKTWYHTTMIGRYGKQDTYWGVLNEGITEMITIRMLSDHWLKYINSPYQYNIALINNMVSYVSQKTGMKSSVLYDLLIKWYFHGDYKVLKLFEKVVGKEFGEILMKENNLLDIQEQHLSLQKKWFFKKYPFMDVDIEKMITPRQRII